MGERKMRKYPLFVIDTSRAHGRARETDFLCCTSEQEPFTAEITLVSSEELELDQDYTAKNPLCLYSDANSNGIRAKIKAVQGCPSRALLKRALKEWMLRRNIQTVNIANVTNENILGFLDALIEQSCENLRENPKDAQAHVVLSILRKIKSDYESK